jgi:hypothetical protein
VIDQLLLVVGLAFPLSAVTTAESKQPVANPLGPSIVGGIVIVVSPPKDWLSSDVVYRNAMSRLIAEQKEMANIERHEKEIREEYNKDRKEYSDETDSAFKRAEGLPEASKVVAATLKVLTDNFSRDLKSCEEDLERWYVLDSKQRQRVEQAREAVDVAAGWKFKKVVPELPKTESK